MAERPFKKLFHTPTQDLKELRERYVKEVTAITKMCKLLAWAPPTVKRDEAIHPGCKVLSAAMFSAKSTLPKGSHQRVFVQDLTAALERREVLVGKTVSTFRDVGYEYMEA